MDVWLIGDVFLEKLRSELENIKHITKKDKDMVPLYLDDFFNINCFTKTHYLPNWL